MNTQCCMDCSVVALCIARGAYQDAFARCLVCRREFPITTAWNPKTDLHELIQIGRQVHIPMRCPKGTHKNVSTRWPFFCNDCLHQDKKLKEAYAKKCQENANSKSARTY